MFIADDYEIFLKRLRALIHEGAITTKLQVFCFMLNYVACRLAEENEPMDAPHEGKSNKQPQQNVTNWSDHFGGKIYQNEICTTAGGVVDDEKSNRIIAPL